jgi:glycosyltransferase involved in cell wall biosynthesis
MSKHVVKVSIGFPVHNGEKFIRQALDSVLAQTFLNFELIICDNASTDGTEAICQEYMEKDARIRYVRHAENMGGYSNFQYVLAISKASYFTWLSHDDLMYPDFLKFGVAYLESHIECVCYSGSIEVIDEGGLRKGIADLKEYDIKKVWGNMLYRFFVFPLDQQYFFIYGLFRRPDLTKVMLTTKQGPFIGGMEYPILSKIALAGEIRSEQIILRAFRRHNLQDHGLSDSAFIRKIQSIFNISLLRLRVLYYLIASKELPLRKRIQILSRSLLQYLINYFHVIVRKMERL